MTKVTLEKIEALLKGDIRAIEFQFKLLGLLLIYFEMLKDEIVERTKSFLSDDFKIDEKGELITIPSEKYLERIKNKSEFRACRDFHLEIGAITKDEDELLDKIIEERNRAAHEGMHILLNDKAKEIDFELVFKAVGLYNKIDNWWIVNFELAIDPDAIPPDVDREEAEAGAAGFPAILMSMLIRKLFGLPDSGNEEPKPERA